MYRLWPLGVSETSLRTFPASPAPRAALAARPEEPGWTQVPVAAVSSPSRPRGWPHAGQPAGRAVLALYRPAPHLAPLRVVFFLLGAEQFGQAEIRDLDVLRRLHQHIPGRQVSVHQAPVFQVVHALQHGAAR